MSAPVPEDLTAPRTVTGLAAKVAAVEQFSGFPKWRVVVRDLPAGAWVIEWDHLALYVPARSDLELARFVAEERRRARLFLRERVVVTALALGLPRTPFLHPAERPTR